jgi:hypothetical protein
MIYIKNCEEKSSFEKIVKNLNNCNTIYSKNLKDINTH